jgi:carbonic anhydrase
VREYHISPPWIKTSAPATLAGLLAKIQPAVDATAYQGERSAKNDAFVDAVARKNIELTMTEIHRRSAVIAALETKGTVKIAGAMYNLETAGVGFFAVATKQ